MLIKRLYSSFASNFRLTSDRRPHRRRWHLAIIGLVLAGLVAQVSLAPETARAEPFASQAFRNTWARSDLPVLQQAVKRSYTYGAEGFFNTYEPYVESPNGARLVQYFDKARMELTRPGNDPRNQYYVTNGLLVKEMVLGNLQLGDYSFVTRYPAYNVVVAGDPADVNPDAPTYASFYNVASTQVVQPGVPIGAGSINEPKIGFPITNVMQKNGQVGRNEALGGLATIGYYDRTLGHNVAGPIYDYLQQRGVVFDGTNFNNGTVFDWVYTVGYPIAEPYWVTTLLGGKRTDVLVQLFERRVITYTPSNPVQFQVEMGNVGQHYYRWRYDPKYDVPVPPASNGSLSPQAGFPGAKFVLRSRYFIQAEDVQVTIVTPEGKSFVLDVIDGATQNPYNDIIYPIQTNPGAALGLYTVIWDGLSSANKAIFYFRLIQIPGIYT